MIHQLRHPWEMALAEKSYYYCDDPACRIIYFDEDDETITIDQLRTPVGVKSDDADATICYCFGVSKSFPHRSPPEFSALSAMLLQM